LKPLFDQYPEGIRGYEIRDWTNYGKSELITADTSSWKEEYEFLHPCK